VHSRCSPAGFESSGFIVQTVRLATSPFAAWLPSLESASAISLVHELEQAARASGFEYLSLGPALPGDLLCFDLIPELLAATQNVFLSGLMTCGGGGVSLPAVRHCARIIEKAASLSPDGFTNLRFAALANVRRARPSFRLLIIVGRIRLCTGNRGCRPGSTGIPDRLPQGDTGSLSQVRDTLVESLQHHAGRLEETARALEREQGVHFGGIDFSPAPFPDDSISLGAAIEWLGSPQLGLHGSLAAAAVLAEAIDRRNSQKPVLTG